MFKITVIKLKDLLRFLVGLTVILLLIIFVFFMCKDKAYVFKIGNYKNKSKGILKKFSIESINKTLPIKLVENQKIDNEKNKILKEILKSKIGYIKQFEKADQNSEDSKDVVETVVESIEEDIKIEDNTISSMQTEIITNNPIQENFNSQYVNVKIKNQTSYELTDEIMNPDIDVGNKEMLIFHTHSCESYTSSEMYSYVPTGTFRTTDQNYSVVKVGDELENRLKEYQYNVIHNKDYHDYPSYNGSYTRSLQTVESILKDNPRDIIIDLHRDAIGSRSDYAPTVKIGEKDEAAQLMFVIGTNEGGLWHPNWQQNLKFAIKVQKKAEELYPGLFKPLMLTKSRYNQHTGKFACIIEVGATGNTLEQCLCSMKYLANILKEI